MRIDELATGALSWPDAFVSAVLAGKPVNGRLPDLLMYYPVAQINPFQQLLYSEAQAHGFSVLPVLRLEDIEQVGWGGHAIVHLHWLSGLLQKVSTQDEANERIACYKAQLESWRNRGLRIVWTIHNIMPHRVKWADAEVSLRRLTAQAADLIHVMNQDTEKLVAPYFNVDHDKVVEVPHPSYGEWYANIVPRAQARQDLSLDPDVFVFLCFGSIQPYKGITPLLDAYDQLLARKPSRRTVLVIAGQVDDEEYFSEVRARTREREDIRVFPGNVRDQRVQLFFNACDVVVAPYLATLNSGVALLGATFRRAVVGPAIGGIAEIFAEDASLLYTDSAGNGLVDALHRALDHQLSPQVFESI